MEACVDICDCATLAAHGRRDPGNNFGATAAARRWLVAKAVPRPAHADAAELPLVPAAQRPDPDTEPRLIESTGQAARGRCLYCCVSDTRYADRRKGERQKE